MSWRTIYVSTQCHLSFKNGYLVIRNEDVVTIHLSEINTLIIDSNSSSLSIFLISKLIERRVKIIFCDEKHNPSCELVPYYLSYNTSKMIMNERKWERDKCDLLWQVIIKYKILYQSIVLKSVGLATKEKQLLQYSANVMKGDSSNREGHAAKVYFNALFGKDFSRNQENEINEALNYGYSILLSMFNREIVGVGYITQIGVHHRGENNPFNLSCDLMEPFRPIIDKIVFENRENEFNKEYKFKLIDIMNQKFSYNGQKQYLTQIINTFVRKTLENLSEGIIDKSLFEYDWL